MNDRLGYPANLPLSAPQLLAGRAGRALSSAATRAPSAKPVRWKIASACRNPVSAAAAWPAARPGSHTIPLRTALEPVRVALYREDGLLQIRGVLACLLWPGLTGSGYGEEVPAGGA